MPNDLIKQYELKHLKNIKRYQKNVQIAYFRAIERIYKQANRLQLQGATFKINDFPVLKNAIDEALLIFHDQIEITIINGIKGSWELAAEKNANVISKAYLHRTLSESVNKLIYDPHEKALSSFIKNSSNGLDLSDRVWKYTDQFRSEIEQNLYAGINEGRSATEMARDQRQYLQEPDKLFRRVRDTDGKLVLSQSAKSYKPGPGIYRSSFKNALRLTRTQVNDSYRTSDMVRYDSLPFVLGYEVKLSNNHPAYDICDNLKGKYGKDFIWIKWHPQCMCYTIPILVDPDEYDRYENALLKGRGDKFKFERINGVPENFKDYINENPDRMINWKRKPDWVTNNAKFTSSLK